MTIKMRGLLEKYRTMSKMGLKEVMNGGFDAIEFSDKMGEYVNEISEKAQQVILEKADERDFVQAINAIVSTTIFAMLQEGRTSQLKFMMGDDLQPFVHTITLSIIGMLIDEEIL